MCYTVLKDIFLQASIVQEEMNLFQRMQLECNKLLDKFHTLKGNFDTLLNEVIQIKYFAEDDTATIKESVNEFSMIFKSVWQFGKIKISEKGRKLKYFSVTGIVLRLI